MKIETLKPQRPNVNPFEEEDAFHMVHRFGPNIMAVYRYRTHPTERMQYLIIVNIETGERVKLLF